MVKNRDKSIASVHFNDEIHYESVSRLLADIEKKYEDGFDVVNVYFSSVGGSGSYAYLLIDYFTENSDRVVLKLFEVLYSAGLWVAMYSKCKKQLLPETQIMLHTATICDGNFKELKMKNGSSTWAVSVLNNCSNVSFLDDVKAHLTEREIKMYKKDIDVYIVDYDRIKKIIGI